MPDVSQSSRPVAQIIVNPAARSGRSRPGWVQLASDRLTNAGYLVDSRLTTSPGHATLLAEQSKAGLIVAAGGDGTVHEVIQGIMRHPSPPTLAVLPTGTGNDVARLLNTHVRENALQSLTVGTVKSWDLIEINCLDLQGHPQRRHAVLFAGVGFASDVIRHTTPAIKSWFGSSLSYAVGFFRALRDFEPESFSVYTNELSASGSMLTILAANAPHAGGGGMKLAPNASMTDGMIDISVIRSVNRWEVVRQFIRLTRGTHIHHHAVNYFPSRELRLNSTRPSHVVADGELIGKTPATLRVVPQALKVLSLSGG